MSDLLVDIVNNLKTVCKTKYSLVSFFIIKMGNHFVTVGIISNLKPVIMLVLVKNHKYHKIDIVLKNKISRRDLF